MSLRPRLMVQYGGGIDDDRLARMIKLAIEASLALLVVSLGLRARFTDATLLFRHPRLLARAVVSMNVIMPLLALWAALVFALTPAIKVALVCLAISPVPPFLPRNALKAGGGRSYTIGLLTAASVLAVIFIPITLDIFERPFGMDVRVPFDAILRLVEIGILVPLLVGLGVRYVWPGLASRIAKPAAMLAGVVLIVALVPILVIAGPAMWSLVGNGTLLAIVLLTLTGLAIGHWLGGPRLEDRAVLALATACRHPGVAIAIGGAVFPGDRQVGAAVLLAVVVGAIVAAPYSAWVRRRIASQEFHRPLRRGPALTPPSMTTRSSADVRAVAAKPTARNQRVERPPSTDHQDGHSDPPENGKV